MSLGRLTVTIFPAARNVQLARAGQPLPPVVPLEQDSESLRMHFDLDFGGGPLTLSVEYLETRVIQEFRVSENAIVEPGSAGWEPTVQPDLAISADQIHHVRLTVDARWAVRFRNLWDLSLRAFLGMMFFSDLDDIVDRRDPNRLLIKRDPLAGCQLVLLNQAPHAGPAADQYFAGERTWALIAPSVTATDTEVDVLYRTGVSNDLELMEHVLHYTKIHGHVPDPALWGFLQDGGHGSLSYSPLPLRRHALQLAQARKKTIVLYTQGRGVGSNLHTTSILRALAQGGFLSRTIRYRERGLAGPAYDVADIHRLVMANPDVREVWITQDNPLPPSVSLPLFQSIAETMRTRGGNARFVCYPSVELRTHLHSGGLIDYSWGAMTIPSSPPPITLWPDAPSFFERSQAYARAFSPFKDRLERLLTDVTPREVAQMRLLHATAPSPATPFSRTYQIYRVRDEADSPQTPPRIVAMLDGGQTTPVYELHGAPEMALALVAFQSGRRPGPLHSQDELERFLDTLHFNPLTFLSFGGQTVSDESQDDFSNVTGYFELCLRFSRFLDDPARTAAIYPAANPAFGPRFAPSNVHHQHVIGPTDPPPRETGFYARRLE